jgi:WD40 repeat protein
VLDDTTIEYQRGALWGIDVASVDGHDVLVGYGDEVAAIGRWRVDGTGPIAHNVGAGFSYADFSPDGRWLLVSGPSDTAPRFVLDPSRDRSTLTLPADVVTAAWLDGEHIGAVTASGSRRTYDVLTGEVESVPGQMDPDDWIGIVTRVADGKLASWYDGHVDVWTFDDKPGHLTLVPSASVGQPFRQTLHLAASSDGEHFYLSGGGLWEFDATTGDQIRSISDPGMVSVTAAADRPVAVGHTDGTITLHDPDDLSEIGTLPGARSTVHVSYDADGDLLLARTNETISLYDVERRARIGDPIVVGEFGSAELRPDGMELAVAQSSPAHITLWTLDPAELSEAACAFAGRNLTRAEWETYIGDLAPYHATCPQYPVSSS